MNRERIVWTVCVVLLATLALQLPGSMAQRDDDYRFVRTLVDIHRQVADKYVDPIDENKLRKAAIDGMLKELDPYTVYVPPAEQEQFDRGLNGTLKGVGIQIEQLPDGTIEVVSPIDGSPAALAGVQAGDAILKINGTSIGGIRIPDAMKLISSVEGGEVTLTVRHNSGVEAALTMTRQEVIVPTVKGFGRKLDNSWDYYVSEDPKIAFVRITQFTPDTADRVRDAVLPLLKDGMRGLILDLRFNPGGQLNEADKLIDLFLESGVMYSTRGLHRPEQIVRAKAEGTLPNFPMIVLVNGSSASASELVAGSLKDSGRAVVVGSRSYGKGSVQEVVPLDGNEGELKVTVAHYYLPSGRLVHRVKDATDWGVDPDIAVEMDEATEAKVYRERYDQELFRRPIVKATTQSATSPATGPASKSVDTQLQRSVDTLVALIVLEKNRAANPSTAGTTTRP